MDKNKEKRHGHQIIASDLVHRLAKGEWQIGEKFPSIDELTHEYDYSRCTVTKGVQELIKRGYLSVRKSVGSFVEKTQLSRTVGIVVGEEVLQPQCSPFAYLLTRKLADSLRNQGYTVLRFVEERGTVLGDETIEGFEAAITEHKLDALITTQCNLTQYINDLPYWQNNEIPHLCVASLDKGVEHRIVLDSDAFLDQACAYLGKCGLHRVGMFDAGMVERGVAGVFAKYRLETRPEWMQEISVTLDGNLEKVAYEGMLQLWQSEQKPEALIIADDVAMKGVALAISSLNIAVPDQLRIIHLANSGSGIFYPFATDRIEYNIEEIALRSSDFLTTLIKHPNLEPETITIPPKLIISP